VFFADLITATPESWSHLSFRFVPPIDPGMMTLRGHRRPQQFDSLAAPLVGGLWSSWRGQMRTLPPSLGYPSNAPITDVCVAPFFTTSLRTSPTGRLASADDPPWVEPKMCLILNRNALMLGDRNLVPRSDYAPPTKVSSRVPETTPPLWGMENWLIQPASVCPPPPPKFQKLSQNQPKPLTFPNGGWIFRISPRETRDRCPGGAASAERP